MHKQVREHAAGVLAGLMKGGDEDLSRAFRERSYASASLMLKKRKIRFEYHYTFAYGCSINHFSDGIIQLTCAEILVLTNL